MKQDKQFDNILNECLDRILKGESVENCLKSYPQQAAELEPLLRTALATKIASNIQPRAEFKARARYEFKAALHDLQTNKINRWSFFAPVFNLRTGWIIAVIVVLVLILGGGGTIAAANSSMPDNALYPVKLVTEQAQLAITPSNIGKTELNAKFADRRADEIAYMANKGNAREVQNAAQRLNTNLENMTNLAKNDYKGDKRGTNSTFNSNNTNVPAAANGLNTANDSTPSPTMGVAPPPTMSLENQCPPSPSTPTHPTVKSIPPSSEKNSTNLFGSQSRLDNSTPVPNVVDRNNSGSSQNNKIKATDREKLKQIIVNNYNSRQIRLKESLKKASPDVKPAIIQALSKSQDEFEKALKNLEQDTDNDQ